MKNKTTRHAGPVTRLVEQGFAIHQKLTVLNEEFKKIKEHYILFVRKKGRKELLTKDLIDFFSTLPVPLGKIKIFKKVIFNAI